MRLLTCLLLACLGLPAQAPFGVQIPATFVEVGMPLRRQANHQTPVPVHHSEVFGLFADPGHVTPNVVGVGPEIRNGSFLWLFTAACHVPLTSFQLSMVDVYTPGVRWHFFSLSPLSNNGWPLPHGFPGFDSVFSDPTFLIKPTHYFETGGPAVWASTHDMAQVAVPDPWPANFLSLKIPAHPALIGQPYSAQSYRLQNEPHPVTGTIQPTLFASDEIVFAIS